MHFTIIYCVIATCILMDIVSAEWFTSITTLQLIIEKQKEIISAVEKYLENEEQESSELKRNMNELKEMSFTATHRRGTTLEYVEHPINAYMLIKRWHRIINGNMKKGTVSFKVIEKKLNELGVGLPSTEEAEGAIRGLLRLQKTYKLPMSDLAGGEIKGFSSDEKLTVRDLYDIGIVAMRMHERELAKDWLDVAYTRHNGDSSALLTDILFMLSLAHNETGDFEQADNAAMLALQQDTENDTLRDLHKTSRDILEHMENNSEYVPPMLLEKENDIVHTDEETYSALCRGDKTYSSTNPSDALYCRYRSTSIPYVNYKEEFYSLDPAISLLHQVISPAEAELVKNVVKRKLIRCKVGLNLVNDYRISKLAWLNDNHSEAVISKLSKRVGQITGLDTTPSYGESFQVVNYGIGGQYAPHHDAFGAYPDIDMTDPETYNLLNTPKRLHGSGDRIATFMFYLHAPVVGGATVFPEIGVRIPAVKYSAALWYNLMKSGEVDDRTVHAGCPVLLGQKWISNKWIREVGQTFHRPCGYNYYS